jgi:hypothetical protein
LQDIASELAAIRDHTKRLTKKLQDRTYVDALAYSKDALSFRDRLAVLEASFPMLLELLADVMRGMKDAKLDTQAAA